MKAYYCFVKNKEEKELVIAENSNKAKAMYFKNKNDLKYIDVRCLRAKELDIYIENGKCFNKFLLKLIENKNKNIYCNHCNTKYNINDYFENILNIVSNKNTICIYCYIKNFYISFYHSIERLKQRYNMNYLDYFNILRAILLDDFKDKIKLRKNIIQYVINYKNIDVNVVFNNRFKCIITFLPLLNDYSNMFKFKESNRWSKVKNKIMNIDKNILSVDYFYKNIFKNNQYINDSIFLNNYIDYVLGVLK